ncbi:hypothetical protein [Cytobacillus luteolus]|uniref:hypothetical protein n=1 Tax=Litchfieldia luteola TaxID=682179 RepID=UPI00187572FE|nr:hypothetical protein [Cytobacillus luteolus]MBP1943576.1 hypothetical protein [Cytobacillus luteolus]
MEKKIVYYFFISIFFVLYVLIFDHFYKYIDMLFPPNVGLILFMFQIGFSIVILVPASVVTTRKIFEIIQSR